MSCELFLVGNIGETHLAIGSTHLERVTNCYRLTSLLHNTAFENFPILTSCLVVAHSQDLHDIYYGEVPFLVLFVPDGANITFFEQLYRL